MPTEPRPMTSTWPRSPVIRRRPSDSSMRRLTSMSVSMAKNTARNRAPSSISTTAPPISHGLWFM